MSHASGPDAHAVHTKTYLAVFVALMILTVVTVSVSGLHLAVPIAIAVALVIAGIKGSLVASYFMHLKGEKRWIYLSLVITVVFFLFLLFIPLWTIQDKIVYR